MRVRRSLPRLLSNLFPTLEAPKTWRVGLHPVTPTKLLKLVLLKTSFPPELLGPAHVYGALFSCISSKRFPCPLPWKVQVRGQGATPVVRVETTTKMCVGSCPVLWFFPETMHCTIWLKLRWGGCAGKEGNHSHPGA